MRLYNPEVLEEQEVRIDYGKPVVIFDPWVFTADGLEVDGSAAFYILTDEGFLVFNKRGTPPVKVNSDCLPFVATATDNLMVIGSADDLPRNRS